MSREKTYEKQAPNVYDVEKIIDIHSSEADPSFDAEKVREATSRSTSRSKGIYHNSTDISPINKDKPDSTERIPSQIRYSYSDMNKDDGESHYKGEI
jgi:hypothetical protein